MLGGGKNLDLEKERQRMANRASYHRNKKLAGKSRGREPWEVWKARFDLEENAEKRWRMAYTRRRSTGDDEFAELVEVIALEAAAAKASGRKTVEEWEAARQAAKAASRAKRRQRRRKPPKTPPAKKPLGKPPS